MTKSWKTLSSKTVYKNKWYKVVENDVIRPNGDKGVYAVVESAPSVFIVALTENNEVYLVGLDRYTSGKYSLELPAGGSDYKNPLEAAKRELQEETGLVAGKWKELGSFYPLNGIASEITHVFLAQKLSQTEEHEQHEEGIIEVRKVPFPQVLEMVKAGEITDGQTIASLMLAQLYLQK